MPWHTIGAPPEYRDAHCLFVTWPRDKLTTQHEHPQELIGTEVWSRQATRGEPPFKMGGWIIRTRGYGEWYMGKWEDNATQQADGAEWVTGVEPGRKWKPYDWAPLCYPQW